MNDTPTPETDAEHAQFPMGGFTLDFARKLERELTAAREELAEWRILNGWGGTPEIINDFIKGQQTRIHYAQNLEEELATVTEQRDRLAEAVNAATILIAAKGRHNTMLAYNGLRDALQSITNQNEL
jgi:hypothetical protein